MRKKIFFTLCVAAFAVSQAGASAYALDPDILMAQTYMQNNIRPWVDPRVAGPHEMHKLAQTCMGEDAVKRIPICAADGVSGEAVADPGYSFGRLEPSLLGALRHVRQTYEARRKARIADDPTCVGPALDKACRVRILDLGAGYGFAMWKFVVAGAHVTAVEPHKPLLNKDVNELWLTLDKAVPFLPKGVKKSDVSHFVGTDAVRALEKEHFQNVFDGVYASYVFHCMSPPEVLRCAALMPGVLKDNGRLWVRVMSSFFEDTHGADFAVYERQLMQKRRFPGFMIEQISYGDAHTKTLTFFESDGENELPPRYAVDRPYALRAPDGVEEKRAMLQQLCAVSGLQWRCRSLFVFDPKSVTSLFEEPDFKRVSLAWQTAKGFVPVQESQMTYSSPQDSKGPLLYLEAVLQPRVALTA